MKAPCTLKDLLPIEQAQQVVDWFDSRPLTDETLKELGFENTMGGVIMKISDSITLDAVEMPDGELRVIIVDSYNGKNVTYWKTVGSVKMLIEALKGDK